MKKEQKDYLKNCHFVNTLIEKPYILIHLNNIDLLCELPFYKELNIVKTSKAFKAYARSYRIEV